MINVLHVFKTYYPDSQGGVEEAIRQICLNVKGKVINRVFSLTPSCNEPLFISRPEASVHRERRWFKVASCDVGYPKTLLSFKRHAHWADIIHYHFPWPYADFLHLFSNTKKPTVVTYHSDVVKQARLLKLYQPLMNRFLSSADKIVATSPNYLATSQVLMRFAEKVQVIPLGIDPDFYPQADGNNVGKIQEEYGKQFFLFVGVLRYYKGLHILLDAMQGLPFKVVIAGEGPEKSKLKAQATRLGLNNVTFTGFVSDEKKVALIKACRAMVFPSHLRSEAFGISLLEGAMFGKPLITAEIGTGTTYVNKHGKTGLVVPPNDANALRKAMMDIFKSEKISMELGENAKARFKNLFTGKAMGDAYCSVYDNVL